jgi:hypothetical protein
MAPATVEQLARSSQFVFHGTVNRLEASTLAQLPAHERTAVVNVDEVIHSPATLDDFTGKEITVLLAKPDADKPGEQAVFFTTSWLYGESLAVIEQGHVGAADLPGLRKQVASIITGMRDEELQDRLARASLVVVGKVRDTRPHKSERPQPVTEHAPDWWQADVTVESVEKGKLAKDRVAVLFAASTDEFWSDSPKFTPGQDGIWILQRNQKERGWPVMREPGLTALSPLDYHPRGDLERIRSVLRQLG